MASKGRTKLKLSLLIAVSAFLVAAIVLVVLNRNADARVAFEKQRLRELGFPMDKQALLKLFPKEGKRNAAPILDKAVAQYEALGSRPEGITKEEEAYAQKFWPVIRSLDGLRSTDTCYWPSYKDISIYNAFDFQTIGKNRELLKSILLCARVKARDQDLRGTLYALGSANEVVRVLNYPAPTSYIVTIFLPALVTTTYSYCLSKFRNDPVALDRLVKNIESRPDLPPIKSAYLLEPYIHLFIEDPKLAQDQIKGLQNAFPHSKLEWVFLLPSSRKALLAELLSYWRQAAEEFPRDESDWQQYRSAFQRSGQAIRARSGAVSEVALEFLPEEDLYSQSWARALADRRAITAAVSLLRNGKGSTIKEIDPFTSKPLKYQCSAAEILVYSVGSDLVDNHGGRGDIRVRIRLK